MDRVSEYLSQWLRRKEINFSKNEKLQRTLTWVDLIGIGVGCVVGAGIFVLTGIAAAEAAGPAISISFAFDFIACVLSALCYTEVAARHPIAGSAYIYAYISVGEFPAFLVGWSICVAYLFTVATVSRGWTGYLDSLVKACGATLPLEVYSVDFWIFNMNPLAAGIILLLTAYTLIGTKQSSQLNLIITLLSVLVILFVIVAGSLNINVSNWSDDFFPYGASGVFKGAAVVFFAYLGFDAIANFSEEVKNPNRDLPIGIIGSLFLCSVLYVAVSLVITGMVPYALIDTDAPLSVAFEDIGWNWAAILVSIGAFAGLTTTMLVGLLTVAKVAYAMPRDGLLPEFLSLIHPTTNSTFWGSMFVGVLAAIFSLLLNIDALADVVSIGILFAFILVSVCVFVLRIDDSATNSNMQTKGFVAAMLVAVCAGVVVTSGTLLTGAPYYVVLPTAISFLLPSLILISFYHLRISDSAQDSFRAPLVPYTPLLSIIINTYMLCNLKPVSWLAFAVALLLGIAIYLLYGVRNSHVRAINEVDEQDEIFRLAQ